MDKDSAQQKQALAEALQVGATCLERVLFIFLLYLVPVLPKAERPS
jgi:hypothetical protein